MIVTARRQQESLLNVPIAITALSADELMKSNVRDFNDVTQFTPGMFFAEGLTLRNDRTYRQFVIRGLNVGAPNSVGAGRF